MNALCAYGCRFGESAQTDYEVAGDHFFREARRALFDDETARLTTVQALAVMGLRQAALGQEDSAFQYIGRAMQIAIEFRAASAIQGLTSGGAGPERCAGVQNDLLGMLLLGCVRNPAPLKLPTLLICI